MTNTLQLSLLEKNDLEFVKNLRMLPEVNSFLGTFTLLNDALQAEWFEKWLHSSSTRYLLVRSPQGEKIGLVRLTDMDFINRSVCVGADIHPTFQNQGYGQQLYRQIFHLVFNDYNLHRAYLYVLENNARAIHVYKKMGFKQEGILRDAVFKHGCYKNYILMSILRSEYQASIQTHTNIDN